MRRLITTLFLLAVCVIALGFYLGWFDLSTAKDSNGGQTDVKIRIDEKRIEADTQKAKDKVKGAFEKTAEKLDGK